jgi:hypothetical protein
MIDLTKLPDLLNAFGWFTRLGKGDTDHVKAEIADLLQHSSQSLRTLIELDDTLIEIPIGDFTPAKFWPIANHCFLFFTSPDAAQKARTHCTDIERDVARINFKMAKALRTEGLDWKGINQAFAELLDADRDFLIAYQEELSRLDGELLAIGQILGAGDTRPAWGQYQALRTSIQTSRHKLQPDCPYAEGANECSLSLNVMHGLQKV